ncbi:RT27 protein, partial [Polypterus senegalus]|nr:28S ribosomal protein S27, mitochondrial [Polypterus senegalus]MBN3293884.1 RT27 protein [Polypterus senegalus]
MAASMLQRFGLCGKGFTKCARHTLTGRRWILSSAYIDPKKWEERPKDPQNLAELANLMDMTYERKLPVSSLTIARFVDNISSREEIDQAEYYLYKFRHSPNCWYLRDWTIHSWIRHCLKHGASDKALYTLKNKVQYGIFPDNFTFNLMIDSFIKENNYKNAFSVVVEVIFQEAFDLLTTQILSFHILGKYLDTNTDLKWDEERNLGAAFLHVGLKHENTIGFSSQLLGYALLGKIELSHGLHSVYHQMPLMWTAGYIRRALEVMTQIASLPSNVKVSQQAIDVLEKILEASSVLENTENVDTNDKMETKINSMDEEDKIERLHLPQYVTHFKELYSKLQSLNKIESKSLSSLADLLIEDNLAESESSDIVAYENKLHEWEEERVQLVKREQEFREKTRLEREARRPAKMSQ